LFGIWLARHLFTAPLGDLQMWQSIGSYGGWNEFIWWLIKLNSLKRVSNASLKNLSSVSIFILRCGNRSIFIVDEISLSDDLSSRTHWKSFAMRLCRAFSVFSHSYQIVASDLRSERISWGTLISKYTPYRVCTQFFKSQ